MTNELLRNKIISSIASKTVSDNLIYLSMAIMKHNDCLVGKQLKYGANMKYLLKAAIDNGIDKDGIGKKVNSINVKNYTDCISLKQALKISHICDEGEYTYDKNYIPDAVCGFVSDEECASMLKDFGYKITEDDVLKNNNLNNDDKSKENNTSVASNNTDTTDNTTSNATNNTASKSASNREKKYMERHYKIIDTLIPLTWNNKRVMTTSQIAQAFGMSNSMLLNRFYKLKDNFELKKDYYLLKGTELKGFHCLNNFDSYISSLYIWTQSGVLLLAQLSGSKKYLNLYQYMVQKYFDVDIKCNANDNVNSNNNVNSVDNKIQNVEKQDIAETYTPSISDIHITANKDNSQQQFLKTPIEIALGIDEDGMTTARKLYEFLEMDESHYSRWVKANITENPFAEENVDYEGFAIDVENSPSMASLSNKPKTGRGNTQDFKLSANFAKKLSMQGKTERAEQARDYFIRVEDKMKEVVVNNAGILKNQKRYSTDKVKYFTSSTPIPKYSDYLKIAKVRKSNDWFYNNYNKIEKILDSFGWERSYLYHIILKTIGQEYDLQVAESIYEKELGIPVEYAMDIVEYFDELSKAATKILNKLIKGISNVN